MCSFGGSHTHPYQYRKDWNQGQKRHGMNAKALKKYTTHWETRSHPLGLLFSHYPYLQPHLDSGVTGNLRYCWLLHVPCLPVHSNDLFWLLWENSWQNNFRKERSILAHQSRLQSIMTHTAQQQKSGVSGHVLHLEGREGWMLMLKLFPLFIQSKTNACQVVPPTFKVDHSFSINTL